MSDPLIHDAHGWTQADRRQLLHLVAADCCAVHTAEDGVPWTWQETPAGVALRCEGIHAYTITYAELAAQEARVDARRRR